MERRGCKSVDLTDVVASPVQTGVGWGGNYRYNQSAFFRGPLFIPNVSKGAPISPFFHSAHPEIFISEQCLRGIY